MRILSAAPCADLFMGNTGEDRKEGLHLSDILVRMAWEKDRKYHPDAPKDYMVFEAGHTWETLASRALSARHGKRAGFRPDQVQEDGIWLSPDWINPLGEIQMEEWKATKKSVNALEDKVAEWGPQVKSYLRALLRLKVVKRLVVRFRVWFIMGDWSFESKGDLTLLRDYYNVDVEYEKRELEENWRGVLSAATKYGLLKGAPQEEPCQRKTERKNASRAPVRSPAKVLAGTFPNTKTSSRPRSA